MRGTKQNIKWDRLISFAWFSCQYAAETLRYTRNLNQNITSEREKTPKLKCYLFEASLSMRVFFFALLESHGKFFKGLYRVCWHMIYPFRWRLAKAGVDTWEKRLMGRTEKAGVEYVCWHSHNNLPNHNHPSVRRALLRPPETGVFFRHQRWKLPQRVKVNFYCTGTRIIPHSPLSWVWDLQGQARLPAR